MKLSDMRAGRLLQSFRKHWRAVAIIAAGVLWASGVAFGLRVLFNYETTPGRAGSPPEHWPAQSWIQRPTNRFTLVMLSHPDCPCTSATLAELEILMAHAEGK